MFEEFRLRMGDIRQEMDRLTKEAEELGRVVQEQQVRLEEMDLQVRQRDEQLAEQQARVEELEDALRQREQEVAELRDQLAAREQTLSEQGAELEQLRAQLSQREAIEATLREELARAEALLAERVEAEEKVPVVDFQEQLARMENLLQRQGQDLAEIRSLFETEMAQLHSRLDRLEIGVAAIPAPAAIAAPTEVAAPLIEETPPAVAAVPAEVAPPAEKVIAPPAEIAPPIEVAVVDPLQTLLYEALESFPAATLVALSSLDGLLVEAAARGEPTLGHPWEVELADLAVDAARVATAVGTGPLLTLAFQAGKELCLLSPVNEDHFAFMLVPSDTVDDYRHAQAVLLRTATLLNEYY